EIDKIASDDNSSADVSGEGVQRDLLPIVEGTQVNTRHGQVRTDHVLFIAAGAVNVSKPSDLNPELQARFPIRGEPYERTSGDFRRIRPHPEHAWTRQYSGLLQVDGAALEFEDSGLTQLAKHAESAHRDGKDLGARRPHTILETIVEDVSFG